MFGEHDRFLNLFARMQAVMPVVPLAGADALFQPVWVEDVARALVRCLTDASTVGRVYECAGPDVMTLRELVRLAGRLSGHERPVFGVGDSVGRAQAALLSLLPGEPMMSADNLQSMKVPNVATGTLPGLRELGIVPTSVGAVATGYLSTQTSG